MLILRPFSKECFVWQPLTLSAYTVYAHHDDNSGWPLKWSNHNAKWVLVKVWYPTRWLQIQATTLLQIQSLDFTCEHHCFKYKHSILHVNTTASNTITWFYIWTPLLQMRSLDFTCEHHCFKYKHSILHVNTTASNTITWFYIWTPLLQMQSLDFTCEHHCFKYNHLIWHVNTTASNTIT